MRKIATILNNLTLLTVIGFIAVIAVVMIGVAIIQKDAAIDAQTYKVEEVVANPIAFQNTSICLNGFYKTSWKVSDIGKTFLGEALEGDSTSLSERVWVNVQVPRKHLVCLIQDSIETCSGETIACGKFIVDEKGLGYENKYVYGLY